MNNLEDRLAAELRRSFDAVPDATGDLEAVKRSGRWRVVRSRAGVVVAAAALVVVAVGSVALLRPAPGPEAAAPTSSAPVAVSTTLPASTTITTVADSLAFTVTARELEVDVDAWTSRTSGELRTRPLVVSDDELEDIRMAARDVLDGMDAEPPYSATLVQHAGVGQIVLLTHATGSCITDLGMQGPWSIHDDPAPCVSTDEPSAWQIGDLRLVVWPDLPEAAYSVTVIPDCGPAAMCPGESAGVIDGVAVFPTRYEGFTPNSGISLELLAYDRARNELSSATVNLPARQVSPREGLVVSPDGIPIPVELPEGFDMTTFAVERRGLILETSTQIRYSYRLLDRTEHATADEQVPAGDVSVTPTVVDGNDRLVVAIGLKRGTAFVTLPSGDLAEVDRDAWSNAFLDMIGDGESTLVVGAGSGFELAAGSGLISWTGSYVDLIGADGQITITTGGCFFDHITPQTDLAGTPEVHERVGTVLLSDESAMWCANGKTVRVEGTKSFVETMLNGLTFGP